MPTFVLVLIQEIIPLQEPAAGWRENYGFWIRVAILAFVVAFMATDQSRVNIGGVDISLWRLALLSLCTSGMFTACSVVVAAHYRFPIPFFILTMVSLFYPLLILSFRLVVGSHIFRHILDHWKQLIQFTTFACAQVMVAVVYQGYEALFRYTKDSRYHLIVILLLPLLKVTAKTVVLRRIKYMEDLVPEAVIFTVDYFNAIYIATCMQSATSAVAAMAITITDLWQTIFMLYGLHKRTVTIGGRLRAVVGNPHDIDLVEALCLLCRDPQKIKKQLRADIRVISCFPHKLSDYNTVLLEKLANFPSKHCSEEVHTRGPHSSTILAAKPKTFQRLQILCARNRIGAIHPIVPEQALSSARSISSSKQLGLIRKQSLSTSRQSVLQESLEVLFSMECLVATAYLEAVIPFAYSCYVVIMVFLPNARYHTEMTGITSENMRSRIIFLLLFGVLQVFCFMVLVLVIRRNCGMKAWHHLAFVLDAQASLVQGKLVAWTFVTMCFRVVHFGTYGV
ncbi:unnamed protein product [Phytophthora fragariaefolia]|uniref:Unnamed protein product n=1 Tax=Phytophthora fragariaefolia TaxID=1490495 RepID=A0A9W6XHD1_9STRA|nr:unnamed protein product [Phytophthora fragariaefolia]